MRIGEIAVVSSDQGDRGHFLESLCDQIETVNEDISFGRYMINDQLLIHFYGIYPQEDRLSLDLISQKILGYIILFRWGDVNSFRQAQKFADLFTSRYGASVVIAGHVDKNKPGMPKEFESGIPIDKRGVFIFCNISESRSVRKVVLALVDQILDQHNN
ncbi:MAG: hypothetical protein H6696_14060 [Deferribacteres bacterium]|nr:hypothetical protein [candidate division KSB1 bacterium]MCB9503052.1 hypothetical protein [Deferribacteres bacterium]